MLIGLEVILKVGDLQFSSLSLQIALSMPSCSSTMVSAATDSAAKAEERKGPDFTWEMCPG